MYVNMYWMLVLKMILKSVDDHVNSYDFSNVAYYYNKEKYS